MKMIAMQYKVILPKDYDMGKKRVKDNSHKTEISTIHMRHYMFGIHLME
jgi:hypothetical protein